MRKTLVTTQLKSIHLVQTTERITDLDKLNFVEFAHGSLVVDLKKISTAQLL